MSERAEEYPRECERDDCHDDVQPVNDDAGDELLRHGFFRGVERTDRIKRDEQRCAGADRSRHRDGDPREETSVSAFEKKKKDQYDKCGRDRYRGEYHRRFRRLPRFAVNGHHYTSFFDTKLKFHIDSRIPREYNSFCADVV